METGQINPASHRILCSCKRKIKKKKGEEEEEEEEKDVLYGLIWKYPPEKARIIAFAYICIKEL